MKKLTKSNKLILSKNFLTNKIFFILKLILYYFSFLKIDSNFKYLIVQIKQFYNFKVSKFTRYSFFSKFKRNCLLTHRSHSVYSLFRLSRIKIKELAWRGLLTGLKHSSW